MKSSAIVASGAITHLELGEHCVDTDLSQGTLSGSLCDPNDPSGALVGALIIGQVESLGRALLPDLAPFLLFGAMNFYTHIGMYDNIANGTMHKW